MTSKWIIVLGPLLIAIAALAMLSRKSVQAEATINASPDQVWAALLDPEGLKDVLPGCRSIIATGDNSFEADVELGVAGLRAGLGHGGWDPSGAGSGEV